MRSAGADAVASSVFVVRGLAGVVWRGARIVRAAGEVVLFSAIAAALLCALHGFVVPLVAAAFFLGIGAAATVGKRSHAEPLLLLRAGALVLVCALPCVGAVLVGARLAETHGEEHYLAGWALFLGLTFLGTFVLVPLLEAAPRVVLARGGVGAALAASLVATGRRGLVRTLGAGACATAAVALVPLLDALGPVRLIGVDVPPESLLDALAIGGGAGVVSWTTLLLLGGALATEPSEPRTRSRSAFTFVVVGIALLVAATLSGATLVPSPPSLAPPELAGRESSTPPASLEVTVTIERGHPSGPGLLVVRRLGAITTTVPISSRLEVQAVVRRPHRSYAVVLRDPSGADAERRVVRLDDQGRRIDDGPLERIEAQLGGGAGATFVLALALVALAVFRARGRARLHRAVRRGTEAVVAGRLRTVDGQAANISAGIARAEGWQLDAVDGSCMIALPPSITVLGAVGLLTLPDGQEVELVAPEPMRGFAFRQGATPCPRGAALVLAGSGRRDELVGAWALAPAGLLLAASSVAAVTGTILTLGGATVVGDLVPWLAGAEAVGLADHAPVALDSDETDAELRMLRVNASEYAGAIGIVSATETRITASLRGRLRYALPDGAWIDSVLALHGIHPGSLLDLLGFQDGDRIAAVAGIPVTEENTLRQLLEANRAAGALAVRVVRGGVVIDLVFRVQEP